MKLVLCFVAMFFAALSACAHLGDTSKASGKGFLGRKRRYYITCRIQSNCSGR